MHHHQCSECGVGIFPTNEVCGEYGVYCSNECARKYETNLAYVEGGRFENGETYAEMRMPQGFQLSARAVIVLEVEEWNRIRSTDV